MATRQNVASTSFDGTGALGATWQTDLNGTDAGVCSKSTGVFGGQVGGSWAAARWAGSGSFTDDQYSKITYVETDFGSANYGVGVTCRASTHVDAARDYYFFRGLSDNNGVLGVIVNGVTTTFHTGAVTWNDNDTLSLEVSGSSPSIRVEAFRNDVSLGGSFVVTTSTHIDSGIPGITAAGDSFVATGDDWDGGNLVTAGPDPGHNNNPIFRVRLHRYL